MITPEFLESLETSKLIQIYSDLNINITASIIKRILEVGQLDTYTKSQIRVLIQTGGKEVFEETLEKTSSISAKVKTQIKNIYEEMARDNMKGYKELYKYRNIPFKISSGQYQILNRAIKMTDKDLRNFTKTIAFNSKQAYVDAIDKAYFQVVTGGRDYISVIEETVRKLSKQGVTLEDRAERKVQLETAVRRNILTGVKQTADEVTSEIEDELGCNGYEVTSHAGARPSHAKAQGKQYAKTRADARKYHVGYWGDVKHLWEEYGCRHTYFGIILGISEPVYTNKELNEMKNSKVIYQGEKIPEYKATQIQRQLEREQRALQREIEPLKKNKEDVKDLESRLKKKKNEYKQFCNETGLTPQYERTKVIT